MKINLKISIIVFILLLSSISTSFGQALHWLSKPKSDVGSIMNAGGFLETESTLSANGRYIAFSSRATNLIDQPLNGSFDVFVYDRITEQVQRVNQINDTSLTDLEIYSYSAPSSDGKFIAFVSSSDFGMGALPNALYLKNFATGGVTLLSVDENNDPFEVFGGFLALSETGDFVDFATDTKLVDEHDGLEDNVYRLDINNGEYQLITFSEDNTTAADMPIRTYVTSNNGRYAAFKSEASNLVSATVVGENIYLRDMLDETTTLITIQPSGQPSTDKAQVSDISVSNDGVVIFTSPKSDLVSDDTNDDRDLFLFTGGVNQRINLNNGAQLTNTNPDQISISASGSLITFSDRFPYTSDDTNGSSSTYQYDISNGTFTFIDTIIDEPSNSSHIAVSASGQYLLLYAFPDEVTPISSLGAVFFEGLYVMDVGSDEIVQIEPVASNPNTSLTDVRRSSMSSDQRYAVFSTSTPNLLSQLQTEDNIDTYLLDRNSNETTLISNRASAVDISANGRYVLIFTRYIPPLGVVDEGGSNLYLYDRNMGNYQKVGPIDPFANVNNSGLVVFQTNDSLVPNDDNGTDDIYLFNPTDIRYSLISQNSNGVVGNGGSTGANINDDGVNVSVVFSSQADNLINGDVNNQRDVFVADWPSGLITRVSQNENGVGGNSFSSLGDLTADGSEVVFRSNATNLTDDSPSGGNVYLHQRANGRVGLVSQYTDGSPMNISVIGTSISDGGGFITFTTGTALDIPGEEMGSNDLDVFLINRDNGDVSLVSQTLSGVGTDGPAFQVDVYEDLNVSPPLVGVSFSADGELTGLSNHPGSDEVFLYQQGGPDVVLNIDVVGMGIVDASDKFSCATNCNASYPLGTQLQLFVESAPGFVFDRWNSSRGQCVNDTNPCLLTMDQDKQIQAIFIDPADVIFKNGFE